ncbi:MAG: hypothetical protein H0V81_12060, partial [Solirubrobacterales bacterium]|nr:hypothetical protein [Solirubrobacterales bacterium]
MVQSEAKTPRPVRSRVAGGTGLASEQWSAFGRPGHRWERSIERIEAAAEARIVEAIDGARDSGAPPAIDPAWVAFLVRNMPVAAFAFHQCGIVLRGAGERCRPPAVASGIRLQASMQLRQAQAIVLYSADMEERLGVMPIESARHRWHSAEEWRPSHSFLRRTRQLEDWGEQLVAINLCFEPLVGQLLRGELAMRLGERHGDLVSPVIADAGQAESALSREWTVAWVTFLLADAEHGEANAELLHRWVARHRAEAYDAAAGLARLADGLPRTSPPGSA